MIEFAARIGGKTVTYPRAATFIIERKEGKKKYGLVAHRESIDKALGKFRSSQREGCTTRLSATFDGRIKVLMRAE